MTLPSTATLTARRAPLAPAAMLAFLLLAVLSVAGTGPVGVLGAAGTAAGVLALLDRAMRHAGKDVLGPADRVTLLRALLAAGVTGLVADGLLGPSGPPGVPATVGLVALATVALALDAVDGRVARRTGTVSALGARFDMEVDAWLVLVLSAHVAAGLGAWVLAIGGMRYAFVAVGWAVPWLRRPLTPARGAKAVAALQGVVLIAAASGVVGGVGGTVPVAVALALLCWSFGRDVQRLHRARSAAAEAPAGAGPAIPRQRTVTDRAARSGRTTPPEGVRRARPSDADVRDAVAG